MFSAVLGLAFIFAGAGFTPLGGQVALEAEVPVVLPVKELFALADPHGKKIPAPETHQPVVLIVSTPTDSQGELQKAWSEGLGESEGGLPRSILLVLLEDLKAAPQREQARQELKERYVDGNRPAVLLDPEGAVRAKLGVSEGATRVLVYDHEGRLVHVEEGPFSEEARQRVKRKALGKV